MRLRVGARNIQIEFSLAKTVSPEYNHIESLEAFGNKGYLLDLMDLDASLHDVERLGSRKANSDSGHDLY